MNITYFMDALKETVVVVKWELIVINMILLVVAVHGFYWFLRFLKLRDKRKGE